MVKRTKSLRNPELLNGNNKKKIGYTKDGCRRMWTNMGKTGKIRSGVADWHICTANGPEWGDSEIEESEYMIWKLSPDTARSNDKRGSELDEINAKKDRNYDELSGCQAKERRK